MKLTRSGFLQMLPAAAAGRWKATRSRVPTPSGVFDPRDYGASGDGRHPDTQAVQAAIDAAAGSGGGRVYLYGGTFLCGALRLKSNVTLYIETGAVLLGSPRIEDYPEEPSEYPSRSSSLYTRRSLIYAERAENVAILGGGAVDGQGDSPAFRRSPRMAEGERPLLLRFSECRNVRLRDVTLRGSAMWVQNYLACEGVLIDGITVASRVNRNNDGIDIDDCANVRITNCDISSGDDAICLKSTSKRGCRNVVIANCTVSSFCNALKLGTDSTGGFANITITNCAIYDTRLSGLALECVDGGTLERITISNIAMHEVGCAVFLRLGNRGRGMESPTPGRLRHVFISNVEATESSDIGSSITGQPGCPVEDVLLENVRIVSAGGASREDAARETPEYPDAYPEFNMFVPPGWHGTAGQSKPGQLPAHGLYVRHAARLTLRNVDLGTAKADARPGLVVDDAADLRISDLSEGGMGLASTAIRLRDVEGALIQSSRTRRGTPVFLRVEGARSGGIQVADSDLTGAAKVVELGEGASPQAVRLRGVPRG